MIELKNIHISLPNFRLTDISFRVEKGDYFVLLGQSGAGKTVLLETMAGLIAPESGQILLNNTDITRSKIQERNLRMVFQDGALFPHLTVGENIAFPMKSSIFKKSGQTKKIEELAELTNVSSLLKRYPEKLSAGEKQRVALARALALQPDVLLLDEPLSSLDVQLRSELRSLLMKLNRMGQTIIHVTHDYEEAAFLANRIAVIEHGRIAQIGDCDEVFHHPQSEFVARFVGIRNFFSGQLSGNGGSLKKFEAGDIRFSILTDEVDGEGFLVIRGEDITLSEEEPVTSALNNFEGIVTEIEAARLGAEVFIDIGLPVSVLVSRESVQSLKLKPGKKMWISVKASAIKFIRK